jgi:rSAM/selenodomain-associated transferase 1
VIFARAPRLGAVKTRLAADVGAAAALAAYRALGARVVGAVHDLPACDVVVAFTPADGREELEAWLPGSVVYEPQVGGDLGARMAGAIARRHAAGATRVVVIGTDCPGVDAGVVEAAFARLDTADVVLGPALDGGYYLVGVRRPTPEIFMEVPWSAPDTLAVTIERARAAGLTVALLDPLRDIDTGADWAAWRAGERIADRITDRAGQAS